MPLLVLVVGAILALYPILYTLINSLKTRQDFAGNRLGLPAEVTAGNYVEALHRLDLARMLWNSAVTTLGGVVLVTIVALLAAYAIAILRPPGASAVLILILATLFIPNQAIMYPLFDVMLKLGFVDSLLGVVLTYGAYGLPVSTFFFAAYFAGLNQEVIESGRVDGASKLAILRHILVPMSRPVVVAVATLNLVWMWNELLIPLLLLPSRDNMTLMVGVAQFPGQFDIHVPLIAAGVVLGMAPVIAVYLFLQRHLVQGLTEGAVK